MSKTLLETYREIMEIYAQPGTPAGTAYQKSLQNNAGKPALPLQAGQKMKPISDKGKIRKTTNKYVPTDPRQARLAQMRKDSAAGVNAPLDGSRDKELDRPGLVKSGVKKAFSGPHGMNNSKKVDAISNDALAKTAPVAATAMLGGALVPAVRSGINMAYNQGRELYNKFQATRKATQAQAPTRPSQNMQQPAAQARPTQQPAGQAAAQARPSQNMQQPAQPTGASGTMTSSARLQAVRRTQNGVPANGRVSGASTVPKIRQNQNMTRPNSAQFASRMNKTNAAKAQSIPDTDMPMKANDAQAATPAKDNPKVTQTTVKGPTEYSGSFKQAFAAARKDAGNSTGQFKWKDPKSGKVGTFQTNKQGSGTKVKPQEKYVAVKKQTPVAPSAASTTTTSVQGGEGIQAFRSNSSMNKPTPTTAAAVPATKPATTNTQAMAAAAQNDKVGEKRMPTSTPAATKPPGTTKPGEKKSSGQGGGGGGGGGW